MSRSRYTDRERKTSDHFSAGEVEAFPSVSRGLAALTASGGSRRLGALHRVDLGRSNTRRTRASGCCEHRGMRIRSASWRRQRAPSNRARRPRHVRECLFHHAFGERGVVNVIARFDRRAGSHRLGPAAVRRRRAALRVIRKGVALAGVSSGEGSFVGPYNTRLHLTAPRALFPGSPW